jgi:hypothetical protein
LSAICGWEDSGIKPYSLQNPAVSTNHPLLDELAIRLTHWRNFRSGKQRYQGSVRAGFRGREQNLYCVFDSRKAVVIATLMCQVEIFGLARSIIDAWR